MAELIYKEEAYKIVSACFEAYKQKGIGFTEPIYQEYNANDSRGIG